MKMTSSRTAFMLALTAIRHRPLPQCEISEEKTYRSISTRRKRGRDLRPVVVTPPPPPPYAIQIGKYHSRVSFSSWDLQYDYSVFAVFGLQFNMRMAIRNTNSLQSQYIGGKASRGINHYNMFSVLFHSNIFCILLHLAFSSRQSIVANDQLNRSRRKDNSS
jgi:hypothetical protein